MKQVFVAITLISLCFPVFIASETDVPWSQWSNCSVSCGSGVRTRQTICRNVTKVDYETCSAADDCPCDCSCKDAINNCKTRYFSCSYFWKHRCKKTCGVCTCPTPCPSVYGEWKEWNPCSVSCGGGLRVRYRDCTTKNCFGSYSEQEICNEEVCANNGSFGPWMDWTTCSVTCGTGIQQRSRTCGYSCTEYQHQKCSVQEDCKCECSCKDDEGAKCNRYRCWFGKRKRCKKTCGLCKCSRCSAVYGDWTTWNSCRPSLCGGIQFRYRDCSTLRGCDGPCKEERSCEWGPWTQNGTCNQTCGGGMVSEIRSCVNAAGCTGNDTRTAPCNTEDCAVWGPWRQDGDCSVRCGGGTVNETRSCLNETGCVGDYTRMGICNTNNCTEVWSSWSSCSSECGVGVQLRKRDCGKTCTEFDEQRCHNNQSCPCHCSCKDKTRYCKPRWLACRFWKHRCELTCDACKCPSPCPPVYGGWSEWTLCNVTCGGGLRYRYRDCNRISDCDDYKESKICGAGAEIYCEGGWTVFQRRFDGSVDFQVNWGNYTHGFGNLSGEFWLGLDKIHNLTSQGNCRLRVDLTDFDNDTAYAEYSSFSVDDESTDYTLHVTGYSGTAGDSLDGHNNRPFSTFDMDHDSYAGNCATVAGEGSGGWWFDNCFASALNAVWGISGGFGQNIIWFHWKGSYEALKATTMRLRCD